MRILVPTLMVLSLMLPAAASAEQAGPLAAGKPAGVEQAQRGSNAVLLVLGIGVVAAGVALVVSGNDNGTPPTPTTTATAP